VSGSAPDAGSEQAGAAGAASQIAGQVSAVTTQIGTLSNLTGSTTDGYPAAGTRQDLVAALAKGRDLLSTLSVAPQNAVDADGCPTSAPAGTLRSDATAMGVSRICSDSVAQAPTPEAAKALKWVLAQLGAPYACGGVGRDDTYRFDCSSLVSRAYSQGAGLKVAKPLTWTPSTRDMIPNDGHTLASWVKVISNDQVRPGDIALYSTGNGNFHVVMLLADGLMIHTNRCGDVAHITKFWGYSPTFAKFLGVRRIDPAGA